MHMNILYALLYSYIWYIQEYTKCLCIISLHLRKQMFTCMKEAKILCEFLKLCHYEEKFKHYHIRKIIHKYMLVYSS